MVMKDLDHNDNGLISQKEFKDAILKLAQENKIYLDDQVLA